MHFMVSTEISRPILKAGTAWALAIFTSMWDIFNSLPWDKLAQFAAFIYSLCLIYEYVRKRAAAKKLGALNGTE